MKNIKLVGLIIVFGLLIQAQTSFAQSECAAADAHFAKGKSLIDQGKYKDAHAELSIYVGCNPQKFDGYSQRARAEILANDLEPALGDATKALALNPQDANAFNVRGLVNKTKKNYEAAIKDFTEAIRLEPTSPKAYVNRSGSYMETKDMEKALVDANKAIELAPTFPKTCLQRGLLNFSMQNWAVAEKDFSQAIKLGDNTEFIYMNRGAVNHNLANYDQAIADDRKALELDPNDATAKKNLELSLAQQKQPDKKDTKGSLDLNAIDNMILAGEFDSALKIVDDIIKVDPNNAAAYTERAFYFNFHSKYYSFNRSGIYWLQELKQSIADAHKAISIDKNYAEAWLVSGDSKRSYDGAHKETWQSELDEADRIATETLAKNPKNARYHFVIAEVLIIRSQEQPYYFDAAITEFGKAVEFDPNFTRAYLKHGFYLATTKRNFNEALKDFNKVLELCPKSFDGYVKRGENYMNLGEFEKAHSDFYQAVALRPNDENGQFWVKNYINTNDERVLKYNYFNRIYFTASRAFDSEIVRHEGVKKTQPSKLVGCQSLAKFYAAFQDDRTAFGKMGFIDQYPQLDPHYEKIVFNPEATNTTEASTAEMNSVKFAIYFNKTHSETISKNLANLQSEDTQYGCNLGIQ